MALKIVRNKDYNSRDTYHRGECPRFPNKTATLFIQLSGSKIAKDDLDSIYHVASFECSILNDTNDKRNTCRLDCPIIKEFRNSHSY